MTETLTLPASNGAVPYSPEWLNALTDAENGTLLSYDVEAIVGGKMAQLGARLMNGVAKNNADQFFNTFAKIVSDN